MKAHILLWEHTKGGHFTKGKKENKKKNKTKKERQENVTYIKCYSLLVKFPLEQCFS